MLIFFSTILFNSLHISVNFLFIKCPRTIFLTKYDTSTYIYIRCSSLRFFFSSSLAVFSNAVFSFVRSVVWVGAMHELQKKCDRFVCKTEKIARRNTKRLAPLVIQHKKKCHYSICSGLMSA